MAQIHATAVAIDGDGILLTGESGSGKSDLALRLINRDAMLVADDRSDLAATDGQLRVSAPSALEGMLEIRGVGIVVLPFERTATVRMVCVMTPRAQIKRLPEVRRTTLEGLDIPTVEIDPFEVSAPDKVCMALRLVNGTIGSVA